MAAMGTDSFHMADFPPRHSFELIRHFSIGTYSVFLEEDGRCEFAFVCSRWLEICGFTHEQFAANPDLAIEAIHPEDRQSLLDCNQLCFNSGQSFRWQGRLIVRGKVVWVSIESNPRLLKNGRMIWDGVMIDITRRIEAEKALLRREAFERELRDCTLALLRAVGAEFNEVLQRSLARIGELSGFQRGFLFCLDDTQDSFSLIHEWGTEGTAPRSEHLQSVPLKSISLTFTFLRMGQPVVVSRSLSLDWSSVQSRGGMDPLAPWSVILFPLRWKNEPFGFLGFEVLDEIQEGWAPTDIRFLEVFSSIVESAMSRERMTRELEEARQRETIGHLASGMAHDFNNLLGVMDSNIQFIGMRLAKSVLDPEIPEVLESIHSAALHARVVASGMVSLSRGQVALQNIRIGKVIADLLRILQRILPKGIRLETQIDNTLDILSNAGFLQAALLNLLLNARDALGHAGELRIAVEKYHWDGKKPLTIAGIQPGEVVRLRVTDTGCGIPPEVLGKVFNLHFTTKPKNRGHGLGLYMVQEFVLRTGAGLAVESTPGSGTCFDLYLPQAVTSTTPSAPVVTLGVLPLAEVPRWPVLTELSTYSRHAWFAAADFADQTTADYSPAPSSKWSLQGGWAWENAEQRQVAMTFERCADVSDQEMQEGKSRGEKNVPSEGDTTLILAWQNLDNLHSGQSDGGFSHAKSLRKGLSPSQELASEVTSSPSAASTTMLPRQILVVDDDPRICASVRRVLKLWGIPSLSAVDGMDCLDILASESNIGLVLSDMAMPRLDGIGLVKVMVQRYPSIPCILMTGQNETIFTMEDRLLDQKILVLRKPIDIPALKHLLEELGGWIP